jgi:predicted nucleic-acid-binding Zn-ribbon protein
MRSNERFVSVTLSSDTSKDAERSCSWAEDYMSIEAAEKETTKPCPKCGAKRALGAAEFGLPSVLDPQYNRRTDQAVSLTKIGLVVAVQCGDCGYVELFGK